MLSENVRLSTITNNLFYLYLRYMYSAFIGFNDIPMYKMLVILQKFMFRVY